MINLADTRESASGRIMLLASLLSVTVIAGCSSTKPKSNQVFLMPAPGIYEEGELDPFIDQDPISLSGVPRMLYATDRLPADEEDRKYQFYTHERGHALRLGAASTLLGVDEGITWEEARQISLLKNRTENYPIQVIDIDEYGVLESTVRPFDGVNERSPGPGQQFADEVNLRLARSDTKDVFIYVHGYKVNFENPVLVASELWHFLGYRGAFIAYSWPTKASVFAYLTDLDSALNSARNLRKLILHVAANTDAEKIHVIGYSMGTRLVSRTVADLGMYTALLPEDDVGSMLKLGNVVLTGSDIDPNVFSGYLVDGALRAVESLTIYQSQQDRALGMSEMVFGRQRTGQVVDEISPEAKRYLDENPKFRVIDVTDAEESTSQNGHGYLRSSPSVSSDILMTLLYELSPEERGLEKPGGAYAWQFPDDYVERLRRALAEANPALELDTAQTSSPGSSE